MFMTNLDLEQSKLKGKYKEVNSKGVSAGATVDGYLSWMFKAGGAPGSWDMNVYAFLCEALDVDAIVLINNNVLIDGNRLMFKNTIITMFGPNPIKKIEGVIYPGLTYWYGHAYGQTALDANIPIVKFRRKEAASENFEGYERVPIFLTNKLLEYIKINTERCIEIHKKKEEKANKKKNKKKKKK